MNNRLKNRLKSCILAFIAMIVGLQSTYAQDVLTSVKYTVKNAVLSSDSKEISYDVYLKDVNSERDIAVPSFTFRLTTPVSGLGAKYKQVRVTNGTSELGAGYATMTLKGDSWLMKFNQQTTALKYKDALILSDEGDGTLMGTFHIRNTDGSAFENITILDTDYSGVGLTTKSTVAVLNPNTIKLTANSTTALSKENIIGLGALELHKSTVSALQLYPNPTVDGFHIIIGDNSGIVNVFSLSGKKIFSKIVSGSDYVDISSLSAGVYLVEFNGNNQQIVKK